MEVITENEFKNFTPRQRGYAVYMVGSRNDQPHVPDEDNPYKFESFEWDEWEIGRDKAILEVQDNP